MQNVFVWTLSDVIGIVCVVFFVIVIGALKFLTWLEQYRCRHDKGVRETQACEAMCNGCNKNLGFIGAWREKQTKDKQ